MKTLISPKQVARAIGVSESTLKRWCDRGLIPMVKTAGGHRRMDVQAVIRFLQDSGHAIVEPELLGLPAATGQTGWTLQRARKMFVTALVQGDESIARQIMFDLLLAGHSLTSIFDDVAAPAFHDIGDQWACGETAVYQERRACELCMRILRELRPATMSGQPVQPAAIGATLEHDNYTLAVTMAEIVLRSVGWHSTSLGTNLPSQTLIECLQTTRPKLIWLSASHIQHQTTFVSSVNSIFDAAHALGIAMLIGGRAVEASLRRRLQYTAFCESFRDLERFARSMHPFERPPTPPAQ